MIKNKYGYFSEDKREFIITDPRTPRPWYNYMWNGQYAGLISHTGGGFSYLDSPRDNRITRMRYNSMPWDRPGRYIMLKDVESGEYWSLSWAPTIEREYDFYEAHVGQGYTTIITEYRDIRATLTYFVPRDTNCEVWKVEVENKSDQPKKLQVYAFQELMMGNALNDIINQPNDKHFTDVGFNEDRQALEATRRYWVINKKSATVEQPNFAWPYKTIFSMNLPITGYDGSLDHFIGKWRSESNPQAIENGTMGNSEITAGEPVVALQSALELEAGGTSAFSTVMAVADKNGQNMYEDIRFDAFRDNEFINQKLMEVKQYWTNYLGHLNVQTPDEALNTMLNVWNPYQCAVTFDMARNAGFYHGGLLFGTGMRDQFQDILGRVIAEPDKVRERLINALHYQFEDGSTLHNFFKLTGHGERTHHSDTPLWIPFGIIEYLNETHDYSILDEVVPFYDQHEATVYEHMVAALDFAISDTTERHLPKIWNGDWNDTLDHIGPKGRGETIWGAMFLCYVLDKTFELLDELGDTDVRSRWENAYDTISDQLNKVAWDGYWYARAFRDNGDVVGSASKEQGKLFLNTQSWAVISGIAPPERASSALESCVEHLENKTGMQICWPAYRKVEEDIGLISRCVPGKKENGAVFNHASSWFVLAAIKNGNVDDAYRIYKKMLPVASSQSVGIDRYETEPYVYSEYVTSREHETEGQASHSWLTGSSVWMFRIGVDRILGLRTSLKGIKIEPHVPKEWDSYYVERVYKGKRLAITVENPNHVDSGIVKLEINGETHEQDWINVDEFDGEKLEITAIMGQEAFSTTV